MANRTIEDVIAAANAIFVTVPGIKKAFAEAPDVPPSGNGDLPCVIPIVQGDDFPPMQAYGLFRIDQHIKFLLLVTPYSTNLISIEKKCRPFLNSVAMAFAPYARLNDREIDHAQIASMHYGDIRYNPATTYVGYEIMLDATVKNVVTMLDA